MAALSEPLEGGTRRRLTLCLRYVVNPGSLLPLYAATVDLDLHPHLGDPLKVSFGKGVVMHIASVSLGVPRHQLELGCSARHT